MTPADRDEARAWLRLAWGPRAEVETDRDGVLWVAVDLPDGHGHISGSISSLSSPLLIWLSQR